MQAPESYIQTMKRYLDMVDWVVGANIFIFSAMRDQCAANYKKYIKTLERITR